MFRRLKPWEVNKNWWLEYWPFIYLKSYSYFTPSRKRKSYAIFPSDPKPSTDSPNVYFQKANSFVKEVPKEKADKKYGDLLNIPIFSDSSLPKLKRRKSAEFSNLESPNTPSMSELTNDFNSLIKRIQFLI